jgi:hypothetical protein
MFFTNNGCLCCTVRTDLIDITNKIFSMAKSQQLDAILVETTGMANPTPIMHTFLQYPCAAVSRLDAVITMVDGKHILKVHTPLIFCCDCFDYTKMSWSTSCCIFRARHEHMFELFPHFNRSTSMTVALMVLSTR